MKENIYFSINHLSINVDWMRVYECRFECIKLDDWGSCENDYVWNPSTHDDECNKTCKIDEYLDIEKFLCEKRLIGKKVLQCEDEKLNTTETFPDDKRLT